MLQEITPLELKQKLASGEDIQLIDVREAEEFEICNLAGSRLMSLGEIASRTTEISTEKPVIVICHHGFRSAQAIQYLSQRFGFTNLLNLKGGIHQWALQVDPEMKTY
jgi:rhodanese-related sulfurtransferase